MNRYLLPGAALMSVISGGASAAPTPIGTFNQLFRRRIRLPPEAPVSDV